MLQTSRREILDDFVSFVGAAGDASWMWDAFDNAVYDLDGMQNTVDSLAAQAHAQHCY